MTYLGKGILLAILTAFTAMFFTADVLKSTRNSISSFVSYIKDETLVSKKNSKPSTPYNVLSNTDDYLFTKEELAQHDGSDGSPGLYLGILGRVYDVQAGDKHYGEGGGYSFFRARDGTKAFMTGQFDEEGLIDEVTGLSYTQMLELEDWIKFYDKTYKYKGKLVGNFYDESGKTTPAMMAALDDIAMAHVKKREEQAERERMPPCNSHQKDGVRRVWCSNKSGGVKRDWVGVPRAIYKSGNANPRCVCVQPHDLSNPQLQLYQNCDPQSTSCTLPVTK